MAYLTTLFGLLGFGQIVLIYPLVARIAYPGLPPLRFELPDPVVCFGQSCCMCMYSYLYNWEADWYHADLAARAGLKALKEK